MVAEVIHTAWTASTDPDAVLQGPHGTPYCVMGLFKNGAPQKLVVSLLLMAIICYYWMVSNGRIWMDMVLTQ